MPHLPAKDILDLLINKWKHGITEKEQEEYTLMAETARKEYFLKIEDSKIRENDLRQQIHELQFGVPNQAVKPTGKLRFLTAFRYFRKEEIPKIKADYPHMEGRQRHALVKQRWRILNPQEKFPFVLLSRASEERSKYLSKIA